MKRLISLMMCAVSLGAAAQSTITYPYNPDGNADGDIAVGDLQDFLVTYGNPFSPSEIMVGDSSLTYWVEQLSQTIQEQQEAINFLAGGSPLNQFVSRCLDPTRTILNPQGYWLQDYTTVFLQGTESYTVPDGYNFMISDRQNYSNGPDHFALLNGERIMPGGANEIGSGFIFNSGDDIGFLGEDSVYLGGFLIPQEPWIQYVYVDLILQGSYSVPEGKKFVVRDLKESGLGPDDVTGIVGPGWLENHGLSPGFTTEDHQRSLYRLTNLGTTYPSGTTIEVSSGGQAQSETGYYAFLQGYLIDEDYFDTPLQDLSDEQSDWGCGDPVSYEGHDYQTVKAGGRCWFAETLKYLPEVHEWSNQSSNEPRFYLRDYSGTSVEEARNESGFDTVGVYYNWTATAMNLCPTGWSVPLLDDWLRLLPVFGGSLEPNLYGTGSYMIDEDDWPQPDLIPHGKPYDFWQLKLKPNGRFIGDSSGELWENVGTGFYQNIPPNGMLAIGAWDLNLDVFGAYGYSNTIRCIKDAE